MAHEQDTESIVGQFYAYLCRFALSLTINEVEPCELTSTGLFLIGPAIASNPEDEENKMLALYNAKGGTFCSRYERKPAI